MRATDWTGLGHVSASAPQCASAPATPPPRSRPGLPARRTLAPLLFRERLRRVTDGTRKPARGVVATLYTSNCRRSVSSTLKGREINNDRLARAETAASDAPTLQRFNAPTLRVPPRHRPGPWTHLCTNFNEFNVHVCCEGTFIHLRSDTPGTSVSDDIQSGSAPAVTTRK